ncbi:MAG TPA: DUF4388 domain-containing protein [Ktedonobacteraceae bacterium]|jgi:hypothetical protein
MTKKRENSADRLVDVLELIRSRCHSGLLSVERFAGERFEEGELYFEMGRPVYARTGHRSGAEAFARLVAWRQIYFFFDKDAPHPSVASEDMDTTTLSTDSAHEQNFSGANHENPEEHTAPSRGAPAFSTGDRVIPRKLVSGVDVETLSLTRLQRLVYLLVDGRRTIADLARCLGRNTAGVKPVLDELQEQGLIFM